MLVCELHENCMQAETTLVEITRLVMEHVTSHEQGNAEVGNTRVANLIL